LSLVWCLCYVRSSFDELVATKGFGMSACCGYLEDSVALMQCVRTLNAEKYKDHAKRDTLFVTYISNHVLSYAASFSFYNLFQLTVKHYPLLIFDEENSLDYYPKDRRWNKIKLLHDGLNSWGKNYSFIVYLDADIMLHKFFSILEYVMEKSKEFSYHNVILSEDLLDYGNSGVLILKNNDWTLSFLQRWWDLRGAKNVFCDQHALNMLSLLLEDSHEIHHLKIVPFPLINSKFPSIISFEDGLDWTDYTYFLKVPSLIHFLGEYAEVRSQIGLNYTKRLCKFLERVDDLVKQNELDTYETFTWTPLKIDLIRLKYSALHNILEPKLSLFQVSVSNTTSNGTKIASELLEVIKNYCQYEKDILSGRHRFSKFSSYDHSYSEMINEISGGCQRYYLSYSEILGNSLHIHYMNFRQSTASDWYSLLTGFLSFYDLKVSSSAFNITFVEDYSQKIHIYEQEYGFLEFLLNDLIKMIDHFSFLPSTEKRTIKSFLSLSFIEKKVTLLSAVCSFYREKSDIRLPVVIADEERDFRNLAEDLLAFANRQVKDKHGHGASDSYPLSDVNITAALKYEQILVSDLYSLIEYARNKTDNNVVENPTLQNYIFQYIESCGSLSKFYYLLGQEQESLEWCELALINMNSLVKEYHGELRSIVELQKSINSQCSHVYLNINETKSRLYEVTGNSLRYHARNLSEPLSVLY
jgi:hypothetical protein